MEKEKHEKKELLDELIVTYYNGSFSQMVCEYIRATKMDDEKVNALVDSIKKEFTKNDMYNV